MSWKNAPAIDALKTAALTAYPTAKRGTTYVGTVGDAAHAKTKSDHNPNAQGYVCAIDVGFIDEGQDDIFVQALLASRDPRLAYIISDGKMWRSYPKPGIPAWTPSKYTGPNPHKTHVHVSVKQESGAYMNAAPWRVTTAGPPVPPAPARALLREGSRGDEVKRLQAGLRRVFPAYAKITADGVFGPATKKAVAEFQRRSSLTADGIVGPATRAALARSNIKL